MTTVTNVASVQLPPALLGQQQVDHRSLTISSVSSLGGSVHVRTLVHRRHNSRPSQADLARAMRAVRQAGGGFSVQVTPEGVLCFVPSHDESAMKAKKQKEFVL
jgi:hypothetical protein